MRFNRTFFVLAVLFCISLILGTIGFRQHENLEWSTAAYKAVQLFSAESGVVSGRSGAPAATPLFLEVARWTALAVAIGAFFAAITSAFYGVRTWIRLRFAKGHDIICGAGEKGAALAADLLAKGGRVALVDLNAELPALAPLKKSGAMVIGGDARHAAILEKAGINNASRLVCATGEDSMNLSIAMAAATSADGRNGRLGIHVHIGDIGHRDVLQRNKVLGSRRHERFEIKTFNFFRNLARQTLRSNPLELDNDGCLCDDVHILLPGLKHLESALAVQTALVGHYRSGGKCTIHVVGADATGDVAQLLKRYPRFENCCRLQHHNLGDAGDLIPRAAEIIDALPAKAFCTVFLCSGDEGTMFTEALLLKDMLPDNDRFRVVLSPRPDSFLREIIGGQSSSGESLARWVSFAAGNKDACGGDAVYSESLDRLAERIHSVWYAENASKIRRAEESGDSKKAEELRAKDTYKPWSELSEAQKDFNRFAADHIETKVRCAGMDPADGPALKKSWGVLDDQTLEMIARVEHERWCAAMWISGWIQAPNRDDVKRHHPDLVPFDKLPEATKAYDFAQVRAVPKYLDLCPD